MNESNSCVVMLLCLVLSGCSDDADNGGGNAGSGGTPSSGGKSGGSAGSSGSNAGKAGMTSSGAGGPTTLPGSIPSAMPLISGNAPAFASSSEGNGKPDAAKDRMPDGRWASTAIPAWLAYDLSAVAAKDRQQVLIAWYAGGAVDFINTTPDPGKRIPIEYTLEINAAAGGSEPPTGGWEVVFTATGNDRNARQRLVELAGANWVRINVTKSTAPDAVAIDLDVHSAPDGASDSWLLMGDSITFLSTSYLFSNLPALVNERKPGRFPAIIPAGIGGTNTTTGLAGLANTLGDYPGRFVGLAYGTNDHVNEFVMEDLVQQVIAAGKTPVVPRMPWSNTAATKETGPQINAKIDELYARYPEILRGPDLWQAFLDHPELFPEGDVHPNGDGQQVLREAWADTMAQ